MMQRREFLKLSGIAGMSLYTFPEYLLAEESSDGYKAMVVVLLHGGNDSINMFIPSGEDVKKGYSNYASIRTSLKVEDVDLSEKLTVTDGKLSIGFGSQNPYYQNGTISDAYTKGFYRHSGLDLATNSLMPELAHLVNQNRVAIVANMGTLIEPVTKAELLAKSKPRPPYLFSHNSQRRLWFTGESSTQNRHGWAGILADNLPDVNSGSIYGMNISIDNGSHMLYGKNSGYLNISRSGPDKYKSVNRAMYDAWLAKESLNPYLKLYNKMRKHSFNMQDVLVNDWVNNSPTFSSKNAYGEDIFSYSDYKTLGIKSSDSVGTRLQEQFKAVAKLAHIGKNSGLKRQIFYLQHGGYDTHGNQKQQHGKVLRELSLSLGDFQLALDEMGMSDDVTTFNLSDFGRSVGNNGNGTDHAWGGHYFVMGGAVKGGVYGKLPDLTLGGDDDLTHKGRLIPTTSTSQYYGTILKWFGVDDNTMHQVLPELSNFDVNDLGFMQNI
jgi:uncharacterized protein (DUF1501 family)